MRVLTLNRPSFLAHCQQLEKLASPFDPDLVVAIASGGVYVAERLFPAAVHVTVSCRRHGTAAKQRSPWLFSVIRSLPVWLRDRLRLIEARRLRSHRGNPIDLQLPEDVRVAVTHAVRVLVVDDAVDSGNTMAAVVKALGQVAGTHKIKTAAVTVTMDNPAVVPDYTLYDNGTLIRFPWSLDMPKDQRL